MRSLRRAQAALWMNLPLMILLNFTAILAGVCVYAFYAECDPLTQGRISVADQVNARVEWNPVEKNRSFSSHVWIPLIAHPDFHHGHIARLPGRGRLVHGRHFQRVLKVDRLFREFTCIHWLLLFFFRGKSAEFGQLVDQLTGGSRHARLLDRKFSRR